MPKGRYEIMRELHAEGRRLWTGDDVPHLHRAGQFRLRLRSRHGEEVPRRRWRLQPVATALFANSPFREGKPNGFLSYRSHIWTDVDNARAGMLPFVFEDGFGFERYVDYALDVPMYFVYRDGRYIDVAGKSFRDFLAGKIPELAGITPMMSDWADHLTTIFPEVRLKTYLEVRGADGGTWRRICGLPALWAGLLYDQTALDAAWDLVKDWTEEEREAMRASVPVLAFKTPFRDTNVLDLARQMLTISTAGLRVARDRARDQEREGLPRAAPGAGRPRADKGGGIAGSLSRRMEGRSLPPVRGLQFPLSCPNGEARRRRSSPPLRQRQPPSVFFHAT